MKVLICEYTQFAYSKLPNPLMPQVMAVRDGKQVPGKQEIQRQTGVLWDLSTRKVRLEGAEFRASRGYLMMSCQTPFPKGKVLLSGVGILETQHLCEPAIPSL